MGRCFCYSELLAFYLPPPFSITHIQSLFSKGTVYRSWAERQDWGSNDTNPFESQALPRTPERLPRIDLDNPPSRPIRKHRNRAFRSRDQIPDYWPRDFYRPREPLYCDRDNLRANRSPRPRREREKSPATLKQKAQPEFVAAMADIDFKDERDDRREDRRDDRRDRGGYRGNNKRRRDGEFASFFSSMAATSA